MIANRLRGLLTLHVGMTVLLADALLLAYRDVYAYLPVDNVLPRVSSLPFLFCVTAGMVVGANFLHGIASRFHRLSWVDSARLATRQTATVALFIFGFMFALKYREMSRIFVGSYLVLLWGMLLGVNVGLPRALCRLVFERSHQIPTLFVGGRAGLDKLKHWMASREMLGLHAVGFVSDEADLTGGAEPEFLGGLAELPRLIAERKVLQVIALELPARKETAQFIIEACQNLGCRLLIYSNLAEQLQHPLVTVIEEDHQFYALQAEPLEDPLNRMLKRLFDVVISLPVVVVVLPPLIAAVWLVQRLQAPGPLFFRQERTGHGQHRFRILKFRSMYETDRPAENEARQAWRGDQRIYPFGHFLRCSSLDEFPQFINVLAGEMSIVGPRPHLVAHDHQFSEQMKGYRTRFFVKPGITGLAQCQGLRGEITDAQMLVRRVKLDVVYVAHWSLWLDCQLVVRTAWQMFFPPRTAC
jgi:exopolysaccharide biosynthesis polyprenyl glycosylphosphotransferase